MGPLKHHFSKLRFECTADGNPSPKYQWLHEGEVKSYSRYLEIERLSYSDQGEYICVATSLIRGERREVRGEGIRLTVSGAPQVVRQSRGVIGLDGGDVRLEAELCSDPAPSDTRWTWGEAVMREGEEREGGRVRTELVSHPRLENCYISRLTLRGVGERDVGRYLVSVTNIHGTDTAPLHLTVRGELSSHYNCHS